MLLGNHRFIYIADPSPNVFVNLAESLIGIWMVIGVARLLSGLK